MARASCERSSTGLLLVGATGFRTAVMRQILSIQRSAVVT
jgi:hypothetical protein